MFIHHPTGRVFKTREELYVAERAWERREKKWKNQPRKDSVETWQQKVQREYNERAEAQRKKRQAIRGLITPLEKKREEWVKKREEAVAFKIKEQQQLLDDALTQIEKLKLQTKIIRGAINSFEKEGRKEWEAKHPFTKEKELKALRNKLYKI